VITGLSGSGKSSLAFDTIYAEGQRRYVESLSAYARQFLELMQKPDVDSIEGLSPAISIEQKTTSRNPRSTVGTVTEIYDYMRLLWARVGVPYSPATGLPIESQTVSQMVDRVLAAEGTRLYLLAPIVRGRKGEYRKELAELQKRGFQRVKVDGTATRSTRRRRSTRSSSTTSRWWSTASSCAPASRAPRRQLRDRAGAGRRHRHRLRRRRRRGAHASPSRPSSPARSPASPSEIEPRLFSFNNPFGACPPATAWAPAYFDPALVVPDDELSLATAPSRPGRSSTSPYYRRRSKPRRSTSRSR
jgi:excinuclease ABC subunit A